MRIIPHNNRYYKDIADQRWWLKIVQLEQIEKFLFEAQIATVDPTIEMHVNRSLCVCLSVIQDLIANWIIHDTDEEWKENNNNA